MTRSEALRRKLALLSGPHDEVFERLWAPAHQVRRYPAFLIELYQAIRAAVPLLETARARAVELAAGDAVCAGMVGYLEKHIEEERYHDIWTLEDLEALGIARAEVLERIPSPRMAALVGAQYYWVLHHHPVAIIGYLAVLEDSPPSLVFIDQLQAHTGFPDAALRMVREHGRFDPEHRADLDRLVDSLPLSAAHERMIGISLVHTVSGIVAAMEDLLAREARGQTPGG